MQRVLSLAKLELKQQLRSPLCWLILLLSSFLAYDGYYSSSNLWEHLYWATDAIALAVLLTSLLAAMAAGRERRQRVGEITESSSVSNWQLALGQWLGLALLAVMTSLLIVIVLVARAITLGGVLNLSTVLFFWILVYLPMLLLGVTVGLTLSCLIPSLFISLPLTVGWWVVLGNLAATGELVRILPGVWADLLDFTAVSPTVPGAAFGFLPLHRFLFNRVAQAGFMLLLLGALMLLHRRYRERGVSWQPLLVIVLALSTTATSYMAFTADLEAAKRDVADRFGYGQLGEEGVTAARTEWRALAEANPAATATYYQIELDFDLHAHSLSADVTLTLRNDGDTDLRQVIFTLNDALAVEQAMWLDQPVTFADCDAFGWHRVALAEPLAPGDEGVLTLRYSGEMWEWSTRWEGHDPEMMSFVSSEGIFLPPHFCWYPVPGIHDIYAIPLWAPDMLTYPIAFQVTIDGTDQPTFTNLESQAEGSWVGQLPGLLIVSGNWDQVKTENVSLLHAPNRLLADYASELQRIYELISSRLGPLPLDHATAITVPNWFAGYLDGPDTQTVLVEEKRLTLDPRTNRQLWQRQNMLDDMLACWYPTLVVTGSDQSGMDLAANNARLGLTSYLWSLYRETLDGQSGSLEQEYSARASVSAEDGAMSAMADGQIYGTYSNESNTLWLELEGIRRESGEDALCQRLAELVRLANRPLAVVERH